MRILATLTATAVLALGTAPALAQPGGPYGRDLSPFRTLDRADREALFDAQMAAIPVALRLSPEQRALWNPVEQSLRAIVADRLNRQEERRRRDEAALGAEPGRAEPRRADLPPAPVPAAPTSPQVAPASPQATSPQPPSPQAAPGQPAPGQAARPAPQGPAAPGGGQAAQAPQQGGPAPQVAPPQAAPPAQQAQAATSDAARPADTARPTERWLEEIEARSQRLAQSAERVRAFSAAMRPFYASLDDRQRRLLSLVMRWPRGLGSNGIETMSPPREGDRRYEADAFDHYGDGDGLAGRGYGRGGYGGRFPEERGGYRDRGYYGRGGYGADMDDDGPDRF